MSSRPPARFDFSGVTLSVEGLSAALEARLRHAWRAFHSGDSAPPVLAARIDYSEARYSNSNGAYAPKRMRSRFGVSRARFTMPEGEAEVGSGGRATIRLVRAAGEDRAYYTLLNLFRACLAWIMPGRGGALLHAAGLVVGPRAFVLVGAANAGKSSWARLGETGGGRVLSDDVVLLDRDPSGTLVAAGAPLYSTHSADYRPGRWPLAAVLYPERESGTSSRPIPPMLCRARLLANLPFIADAIERDARISDGVDRIVREVPQRFFGFALDSDVAGFLAEWRPDGP